MPGFSKNYADAGYIGAIDTEITQFRGAEIFEDLPEEIKEEMEESRKKIEIARETV